MLYDSVCMSYRVSIRCACYPTEKRLKEKRQPAVHKPADCRLSSYTLKTLHTKFNTNIVKNINIFFTIFNYTKQKYRSQGHTEIIQKNIE